MIRFDDDIYSINACEPSIKNNKLNSQFFLKKFIKIKTRHFVINNFEFYILYESLASIILHLKLFDGSFNNCI